MNNGQEILDLLKSAEDSINAAKLMSDGEVDKSI